MSSTRRMAACCPSRYRRVMGLACPSPSVTEAAALAAAVVNLWGGAHGVLRSDRVPYGYGVAPLRTLSVLPQAFLRLAISATAVACLAQEPLLYRRHAPRIQTIFCVYARCLQVPRTHR